MRPVYAEREWATALDIVESGGGNRSLVNMLTVDVHRRFLFRRRADDAADVGNDLVLGVCALRCYKSKDRQTFFVAESSDVVTGYQWSMTLCEVGKGNRYG